MTRSEVGNAQPAPPPPAESTVRARVYQRLSVYPPLTSQARARRARRHRLTRAPAPRFRTDVQTEPAQGGAAGRGQCRGCSDGHPDSKGWAAGTCPPGPPSCEKVLEGRDGPEWDSGWGQGRLRPV